ncbi:hypothetical protein HYH03_003021 [Edaphochlamys debaryana]|uniref:Uncharacterized protein n=1 Tax=Edaphochlamys debaryana TaxID=47281 RepID=A0A835YA15_9CHLO|nr:hypothetical protein HYH03_003021 [Edaphochlamys debaryana]|eukprot:KAG2498828.1 hypothetical protein HYH03_003021 [Edaphochlamys debaryana]
MQISEEPSPAPSGGHKPESDEYVNDAVARFWPNGSSPPSSIEGHPNDTLASLSSFPSLSLLQALDDSLEPGPAVGEGAPDPFESPRPAASPRSVLEGPSPMASGYRCNSLASSELDKLQDEYMAVASFNCLSINKTVSRPDGMASLMSHELPNHTGLPPAYRRPPTLVAPSPFTADYQPSPMAAAAVAAMPPPPIDGPQEADTGPERMAGSARRSEPSWRR